MLITQGESAARELLEMMQQGRVLQLTGENLFAAAQSSAAHGLAIADATIWQTAVSLGATLYTQDAGLKAMPRFRFS